MKKIKEREEKLELFDNPLDEEDGIRNFEETKRRRLLSEESVSDRTRYLDEIYELGNPVSLKESRSVRHPTRPPPR